MIANGLISMHQRKELSIFDDWPPAIHQSQFSISHKRINLPYGAFIILRGDKVQIGRESLAYAFRIRKAPSEASCEFAPPPFLLCDLINADCDMP